LKMRLLTIIPQPSHISPAEQKEGAARSSGEDSGENSGESPQLVKGPQVIMLAYLILQSQSLTHSITLITETRPAGEAAARARSWRRRTAGNNARLSNFTISLTLSLTLITETRAAGEAAARARSWRRRTAGKISCLFNFTSSLYSTLTLFGAYARAGEPPKDSRGRRRWLRLFTSVSLCCASNLLSHVPLLSPSFLCLSVLPLSLTHSHRKDASSRRSSDVARGAGRGGRD
jgi:hypothetical protein